MHFYSCTCMQPVSTGLMHPKIDHSNQMKLVSRCFFFYLNLFSHKILYFILFWLLWIANKFRCLLESLDHSLFFFDLLINYITLNWIKNNVYINFYSFIFQRNRSYFWSNQKISIGTVAHHVQIGCDVCSYHDDIIFSFQRCFHRNADFSIEPHILCHQIWIVLETRSWQLCVTFSRMGTTDSSWPRLGTAQRCTSSYSQCSRVRTFFNFFILPIFYSVIALYIINNEK